MGVVFGEKFRRGVDYAIQKNLPFISLCCSGGARLYEGISALMQMVKTIESINRLRKSGLPLHIDSRGHRPRGGPLPAMRPWETS